MAEPLKGICSNCEQDFDPAEYPESTTEGSYTFCDAECKAQFQREVDSECDTYDREERDFVIDGVGFADPGGQSALRAATASNPRDQACPDCETPNVLTRIDRQRGYNCDSCAERKEGRQY